MTPQYLILGNGRVAAHMGHYFRALNINYQTWSRPDGEADLKSKAHASTHILCLISDSAIPEFLKNHAEECANRTVAHASGALSISAAESAHPLMTFPSHQPYDLATYRSIPFVLEEGRKTFAEVLPGLPNPHFSLKPEMKVLYHALCVMSGNFSVLLWQKAFHDFETKLGLPKEVLLPYLKKVSENLQADVPVALSGPLARGDQSTIEKHLQTLQSDPFADVYRATVKAFQESKNEVSA